MPIRMSYLKAGVHFLALMPAVWLIWQGWLLYDYQDNALTANPIKYIHHYTGDWAVRFLLLGLVLTPLAQFVGLEPAGEISTNDRALCRFLCAAASVELRGFGLLF